MSESPSLPAVPPTREQIAEAISLAWDARTPGAGLASTAADAVLALLSSRGNR